MTSHMSKIYFPAVAVNTTGPLCYLCYIHSLTRYLGPTNSNVNLLKWNCYEFTLKLTTYTQIGEPLIVELPA